MNESLPRRQFLKQTTAAGLGLAGVLARGARAAETGFAPSSANDPRPLKVAVIGTNNRGLALIECLKYTRNVQVAYIADVDDRAIDKGLKETAKFQPEAPRGTKDFRRALDDSSIDAVLIATPDHWHAPMSILALAAGKHVYVEKPCSHNPHEGELLVRAVNKSQRVFQMGNQRRSFPQMRDAVRQIREGVIGKPYFARAWYANGRVSIGHGKPAEVPAWLDYDLWQGPAPRQAYMDNLIHYNWHWFWRYGTGEALNNGTHEVDVARWALGVGFPSRVSSNGGRYAFDDDWQTPDTQTISWDFPEGKTLSWEGRSCNNFPEDKLDRGVVVNGTGGSAILDGGNYTFFDNKHKVIKEVKSSDQSDAANLVSSTGIGLDSLHVVNFVDAIRGGQKPNSPVEEAHRSVTLLHLGNIAWRTGRSLRCNPADGHILDDPEASKLWQRDYEPGWEPKV